MDKHHFQMLYDYNFQANRKVWDCVMELTDEQFHQPLDFSVGSIHDQCVHTMAVEHWWPHFLMTGELDFLDQDQYPTRELIRQQWDAVEVKIHAYLDTLTPQELERNVRPPEPEWNADKKPIKVWQVLVQVANHSTDHRAQTLAMIHRLGGETIEQDFLNYLFDLQQKGEQIT
jgi:uncharacterized damage-inducible protein DinB